MTTNKKKKKTKKAPRAQIENVFQDGPHLVTAVICEKVLEEKDGVKTAVRIVDRFTQVFVTRPGVDTIPPMNRRLALLIRFKKGEAGDKHELKLDMIKPAGESTAKVSQTLVFEGGPDRGIDLVSNLDLQFDRDGVYWVDVYLDEIRVTRLPMRVIFIIQKQHPAAEDQTPVS